MNKEYIHERYPGVIPFTKEFENVFYGRDNDIKTVIELINTEQVVTVYGKSGIGKSSLVNVGVIPKLEKKGKKVIYTRFGFKQPNLNFAPIDVIAEQLKIEDDTILDKVIYRENSLWYHFKEYALVHGCKQFIIVIDQFEELFSYSEEEIYFFKKQMHDLLYSNVPKKFRRVLEMKQRKLEVLTQKELEELYEKIEVKLVISIREDRYSWINQLTDYLPDLIKNRFELMPLTLEQAREAIVKPALVKGVFNSAPFTFTENAIIKILNYLTGNNSKKIESTQLQILCKEIEDMNLKEVTIHNIPDFKNIFIDFYKNCIKSIDPKFRRDAQQFIEEELIKQKQRVSLDRLVCEEFVPQSVLHQLVSHHHLLKTINNSRGRFSYEISHDTLIEPILITKELRSVKEREFLRKEKEKELKIKLQKEKEFRKQKQKELFRTQMVLGSVIIMFFIALGIMIYDINELQRARKLEMEAEALQTMIMGERKKLKELQQENRLEEQMVLYKDALNYETDRKPKKEILDLLNQALEKAPDSKEATNIEETIQRIEKEY